MGKKRTAFRISGEDILARMQKKFYSMLEKKAGESEEYRSLLGLKEVLMPKRVTAVRFRVNGEWIKPSFLAEINHSKGCLSVIYDLTTQKMSLDNQRLWSKRIEENKAFFLKDRFVKYFKGNIVEA